jgi:uncharacterized protein YukE
MSFLGMDIPAAMHQAGVLQQHAVEELLTIIAGTDRLVAQLDSCWKGEDADRFISAWQGQHLNALRTVQSALVEFHAELGRNIQSQATASGD